ncbi:hypothetical protein V6N11_023227 [Hibiscus sabdariffa]|uniref:Uncharacterized protein n=1 Tax=Hibiscus sabdariffa TaxID=183260 RepID=A0ABR2TLK1_9ROSI
MPQSKADRPVKRIESIEEGNSKRFLQGIGFNVAEAGGVLRNRKSRQSSQVSGEDGYNVSFMSKLMGNGSSKLRTDAYSAATPLTVIELAILRIFSKPSVFFSS